MLKYLNLKNYVANIDENCKFYPQEVPVNKIKGILICAIIVMTICT